MKEKPILFSTPMVPAILDDRKTQTRRVIKPQPRIGFEYEGFNDGYAAFQGDGFLFDKVRPKHQPGDILWVRETWRLVDFTFVDGVWSAAVQYKDSSLGPRLSWEHMDDERIGWRPSIFMPRDAARIFLRVTDVRAERVQEISEADARAEGVITNDAVKVSSYIYWYQQLWDKLNAKRGYGWDTNPWVWVYTFERVDNKTTPEGVAVSHRLSHS